MESVGLVVFQVVVMIGLLNLVSPFLLYYFVAAIVEHPLLGYPLDSVAVAIGLLLLRDGLTVLVLACAVLVVALLLHLSVGTHGGRGDVGLADIGTTVALPVQIAVA